MGVKERRRMPRAVLAALIGAAVMLPAAIVTAVPAAAATAASVTVNATAGLGTVPAHAMGLNTAVYDGDMNDAAIPALLKAAGVDVDEEISRYGDPVPPMFWLRDPDRNSLIIVQPTS